MHPEIRTIIADDEPLARKKLRILLAAEGGVNVVAECADGKQTLASISAYKPDLLFLDIQMPEANGFEVLNKVPPADMPVVIFTTAYDQYAIRAFEAHALDYLLKPFDQERLHRSVERARAELLKASGRELTQRILDLLGSGSKPEARMNKRFVIKAAGRVVFLDMDEIDWVEASANYVRLHAGAQSYLLREGISSISARLAAEQFVRIHRSTVVNIDRIKELQPCNSGEYIVVLKDGKELSCSRGYRAGLQKLIEKGL